MKPAGDDPMQVNVLGSGVMGKQIASLFCLAGYQVNLCDLIPPTFASLERELRIARRFFSGLREGSISLTRDLERLPDCVTVEAVSEDLQLKQSLYRQLRAVNGHTFFTNCSSYMPKEIGEDVRALHFFNPVVSVKLVEYVDCDHLASLRPMVDYCRANGVRFLEVRQNRGYLGNFLLFHQIATAFRLIEIHHYDAEEIGAMYESLLGSRNVFETVDRIGVDVCQKILKNLREHDSSLYVPGILEEAIQSGILGKKNKTSIVQWLASRRLAAESGVRDVVSASTFVFKRSGELSRRESEEIQDLFRRVFAKQRGREYFDRKYLNAPLGGAYHALCFDGGSIVAVFTAVPYRYRYFGKETVFALSVDTMVDGRQRGSPFRVKKMAQLVHDALVRDGIPFIFGFPNANYWEYERQVVRSRDIGELDYYVVPRNIGALVAGGRRLDGFSRLASQVLVHWPACRDSAEWEPPIDKIADAAFESHRYGGDYHVLHLDGGEKCIYRTYREDNGAPSDLPCGRVPAKPTVFLPRGDARLYREAAPATDAFLYVGHLPFRPTRMLRVPPSRRPQRIRMTGKILIPDLIDDRVFALENWKVNLSNYDVR